MFHLRNDWFLAGFWRVFGRVWSGLDFWPSRIRGLRLILGSVLRGLNRGSDKGLDGKNAHFWPILCTFWTHKKWPFLGQFWGPEIWGLWSRKFQVVDFDRGLRLAKIWRRVWPRLGSGEKLVQKWVQNGHFWKLPKSSPNFGPFLGSENFSGPRPKIFHFLTKPEKKFPEAHKKKGRNFFGAQICSDTFFWKLVQKWAKNGPFWGQKSLFFIFYMIANLKFGPKMAKNGPFLGLFWAIFEGQFWGRFLGQNGKISPRIRYLARWMLIFNFLGGRPVFSQKWVQNWVQNLDLVKMCTNVHKMCTKCAHFAIF